MDNERHYFLVGLFVLGGALALFMFTMWLTSRDDSKYQPFFIRFAESVSGLSTGSDVKFRGVKVGQVTGIAIDPNDSRLIRVDITLLKTTPVKRDTKANLKLQGITGVVFVELSGGSPEQPNLVHDEDHKEIPEIPAEQSSLNALIDRVPILLDKISAAVDRINRLVSDENLQSTANMLKNGEAASQDLKLMMSGSRDSVRDSAKDVSSAMRHLDRAASRIDDLSERVEEDPGSLIFGSEEKGIPAP